MMKKSNVIIVTALVGVLALLAFNTPSQENLFLQHIIEKLGVYSNDRSPEKTYLHTDKDFYTNGETIWFKTYLLNGVTHRASDKSRVAYVELLNGNDSVVAKRRLFVEDVGAPGDILLPDNIEQGEYTLRAYTSYMFNSDEPVFFEKKVPIFKQEIRSGANGEFAPLAEPSKGVPTYEKGENPINKKITVRFFPEGGHWVAGLPATLGLEVNDAEGKPVAIKGAIKDSEGNIVTNFESLDFGLGSVGFTPMRQKEYYASVIINSREEKFPLPRVEAKGYVLSLKNRGDHILVQVAGNTEEGLAGTLLIGHLRGDMIFERTGLDGDRNAYATKLYTDELPDGVAQFTLFDPDGVPVSERLVFVDNPQNDTQLSIASNADTYGLREKVDLDILLTDTEGTPLVGDFSLGVATKSSDLKASGTSIRSWLLLDSDLGGTVKDPDYFFEDDSNERKFLLDALMLTHGWRRFVWKDLLDDKFRKDLVYAPEKGIMISGKTTEFKKPDAPKESIATMSVLGPNLIQEEKATDLQGEFNFGPYYFTDSLHAIIEAVDPQSKRKSKKKNLSILVDAFDLNFRVLTSKKEKTTTTTIEVAQEYLKESFREKVSDFQFDSKGVTHLEEVVVTKKKKSRNLRITEEVGAELTSGLFSKRIFTDSLAGTKHLRGVDLIRRIPGVVVTGQYPDEKIRIISLGGEPMFLIDGLPVDMGRVQDIMADEIMFIDVVKGTDVVVFGLRGYNGVIAIYRNRKLPPDITMPVDYPGVTNFKIPGFYKAREFYTPIYSAYNKEHEKPDYRTTLLWEPDMKIDSSGRASVDFYTGDSPGSYIVKVEGITQDGRPINSLRIIEVQESN